MGVLDAADEAALYWIYKSTVDYLGSMIFQGIITSRTGGLTMYIYENRTCVTTEVISIYI